MIEYGCSITPISIVMVDTLTDGACTVQLTVSTKVLVKRVCGLRSMSNVTV
ncbi:MAG: hypothetical protein ACK521_00835 [bacterium]